jgi:thiol-disulfide isomerase/thioredoxin
MKIFAVIFALVLAVCALAFDWTRPPSGVAQFSQVPASETVKNVSMETLDGRSFMLHDVKEPVVLLHFWATWCGPCVVEFPDLVKLVEDMDGSVALVAVSLDYKAEPLEQFKTQHDRPDLPIYWVRDKDFSLAYKEFNVGGTPETIIIAPDRTNAGLIRGVYEWDTQAMRQRLTALRAQTISDGLVQ